MLPFLSPAMLHISNGTQSDFNFGPHSAEIINVTRNTILNARAVGFVFASSAGWNR